MINKQQKIELVKRLDEKLEKAKSVVITSYHGLNMAAMGEIRSKLKQSGVDYHVIKNNLLDRVLSAKNLKIDEDVLKKPLAVAFDFEDNMVAIKDIFNFGKENEALQIESGIYEGKVVDGNIIKEIALLPGRDELYAKVVGSISAPISKFVYAVRWNGCALTSVLSQYLKQKQSQN